MCVSVSVCGHESPAERGSSAVSSRQTLGLSFSLFLCSGSPFLLVSAPQQLLPGFEVEVEALICTSMLGRDKKTWHRTSRPPSGLSMSGTHTNTAEKGPKYAVSRGIDFLYFDLASAVDFALLSYMSSCMPCAATSRPVQGLTHATIAALMQNDTE